jgi:predicted DsbA family dithiol-disulfide isomerase
MNERSVSIDVVSDVVCPWCYLGQKRLEHAAESLTDIDVTARWRPFQLDPTIPPGGKDRREYMLAKFGNGDRIREAHARLIELGAIEGISFDFEAIKTAPNTLDAHRLIRWASATDNETQNTLVKRLFSLYFEKGANIGDRVVLAEAAEISGMDRAVVEAMLATDSDREAVVTEVATASRMGITGVPCFLLEGRYAVMGAQDTAVLADAIRQVAEAKARGELETAAGQEMN